MEYFLIDMTSFLLLPPPLPLALLLLRFSCQSANAGCSPFAGSLGVVILVCAELDATRATSALFLCSVLPSRLVLHGAQWFGFNVEPCCGEGRCLFVAQGKQAVGARKGKQRTGKGRRWQEKAGVRNRGQEGTGEDRRGQEGPGSAGEGRRAQEAPREAGGASRE